MVRIDASELETYVAAMFRRVGCAEGEARDVAFYLVRSNLAGHDSHGVVRAPLYVRWVKEGRTRPGQTPRIVTDTPVLAVVDGGHGFGQTMGPFATRLGIEKAKAMGLSAIALRNSAHIGRVGDFAEIAAQAGLVSVHFVTASGSVLVAPFGGVERRISTAPYCVGVPRPGQAPVLLDFATSFVAEGKALVASLGGKPLPEGALIDPDGNLSTDPYQLYGESNTQPKRDHAQGKGAIRAFGEHKGSGLALMCELLGGSLTGTGATKPSKHFANGMFSIFVDPAKLAVEDFFDADVSRYIAYVKSSKTIRGVDEVLTPGEPEAQARADRLAHGVPLSDDAWASIVEAAREAGAPESETPTVKSGSGPHRPNPLRAGMDAANGPSSAAGLLDPVKPPRPCRYTNSGSS
ncbi:MAG: malate/lactate/ureidoglycolate dehydrogenase [Rhizobiales bacterium]|nr:malate/lactate/ureidoglycolate dehydrogenase [Hyphomicrobiales bacterium]